MTRHLIVSCRIPSGLRAAADRGAAIPLEWTSVPTRCYKRHRHLRSRVRMLIDFQVERFGRLRHERQW
jgi:hypothetical protein